MRVQPEATAFAAVYAAGRPQLVWARLVSDLDTPVSAMIKLGAGRDNTFLLESVSGGEVRGRYSIVCREPDLIWRSRDGRAELNRQAATPAGAWVPDSRPVLESLRALLAECAFELPEGLPPMAAGLFGYLGYDMVRQMERLPTDAPLPFDIEDAVLIRPTLVAIFDSIENTVTLATPVWPQDGMAAETAFAQASDRLARAAEDLDRPLPRQPDRLDGAASPAPLVPESNMTPEQYCAMVETAKEYIRAGDIFQVVPSQRFSVPFALPPLDLYRALRRLNPSPFLFLLQLDGVAAIGSSPEILVRLRDDTVTIRPIAGTRPRGKTPAEDAALAEELLADPKERAEHLMLLDLGRNDVGRFAQPGSVRVTERFVIERYSHVMHIVSNVEGTLQPGYDALDALIGGFPAGTVSGAPKVRAMQIIDELEPQRRGIYGGCIGYFGVGGAMDTCIALRTGVLKDGRLHVQAGGGVVYDSDPQAEFQETVNKSKALIRAAEEALRLAGRSAETK